MSQVFFTKMNGAGNDFVVIDNRSGNLRLSSADIVRLCDRHRGIGADGLLAVEQALHGADFRMRYYNLDGGEAEMCGNGARCFTRFAARLLGGDPSGREIRFETPAGILSATLRGELVELDMGIPHSWRDAEILTFGSRRQNVYSLNTGVPHAIVPVDDLPSVDLRNDGRALRLHERFAPKGTNVNFFSQLRPGHLAVRTYERGVEDETLACGTGVVATALTHHLMTGSPSPIQVDVCGGDTLTVSFVAAEERGSFSNVKLLGPADFVFEGSIDLKNP
jgi:diaminopimelate epimerase